jgi:hypothetical protein
MIFWLLEIFALSDTWEYHLKKVGEYDFFLFCGVVTLFI